MLRVYQVHQGIQHQGSSCSALALEKLSGGNCGLPYRNSRRKSGAASPKIVFVARRNFNRRRHKVEARCYAFPVLSTAHTKLRHFVMPYREKRGEKGGAQMQL